jgi:hypothetical protein
MTYFNYLKLATSNVHRNNLYYVYIGCAVTYTGYHTYTDSSKLLFRYRINNKEQFFMIHRLNNDWQVCKYGAYDNFWGNFFCSLVWPFAMVSDVIPIMVLYFNPVKRD